MTAIIQRIIQSPGSWVLRLTWIDYIRRKDLAVVGICMGLFIISSVVIRIVGIENRSSAIFLMGTGFTLSSLLSALLAASFSARAFPEEFERRTLIPLMAKPVNHLDVLLGKYSGCVTLSGGSYLLFVLATILAVPTVSGQQWTSFAQAVVLQLISLGLLCAIAFALSFFAPAMIAGFVSLIWFFGGGVLLRVVEQSLGNENAVRGEWLIAWLPDVSLLNHAEMFSGAAAPLGTKVFAGLLIYGVCWSCFFLAIANWRFRRTRL